MAQYRKHYVKEKDVLYHGLFNCPCKTTLKSKLEKRTQMLSNHASTNSLFGIKKGFQKVLRIQWSNNI
jgi:hypothetical protein